MLLTIKEDRGYGVVVDTDDMEYKLLFDDRDNITGVSTDGSEFEVLDVCTGDKGEITTIEIKDELKNNRAIIEAALIQGTITSSRGYSNITFGCELKDTPAVRKIHEDNNQAIAVHLDGYRGNFGGRHYSLSKTAHGTLKYTGTIYTD